MDSNQSPQQVSRLASWVGLVSINLLLFGILEVGTRIYFSTQIGAQILLYGTPAYRVREQIREATDRAETEEAEKSLARVHRGHVGAYRRYVAGQSGSYSKYLPNQTKLLYSEITGELEAIRINNHGFRGKDFSVSKSPGVIRVLALGGSSTFGYRSQDHETYPHVLERLLNERGPADQRFEVINFGVPHATSEHIVSLFLAEGVALAPEFVTLYAGANDSAIIDAVHGYWGELWLAFCERLLILNFADHLLNSTICGDRSSAGVTPMRNGEARHS